MADALGDLLDLLVRAVVWRVVGELLRDRPELVVVAVGVLAAMVFVYRRARPRHARRRSW